jgi:hypothetical protein
LPVCCKKRKENGYKSTLQQDTRTINLVDNVNPPPFGFSATLPTGEAMEVEGNILPVDLRIEEIAVREIAKIQSKNIAEPVKQQYWRNISAGMIYTCMNNKNHHLGTRQ